MDESKVEYFLARGKSLQILTEYRKGIEAHLNHWNSVGKEYGADGIWREGTRAIGWSFAKGVVPPKVIRNRAKNRDLWYPDKKSPEGKALWARLAECRHPSGSLADALFKGSLGMPGGFVTGFKGSSMIITGVGAEPLGEDWILIVPIANNADVALVPPDAEPMTRSAYWARKEALLLTGVSP